MDIKDNRNSRCPVALCVFVCETFIKTKYKNLFYSNMKLNPGPYYVNGSFR